LPEKQRIGEIRARVRTRKDRRGSDAVIGIDLMRRKAVQRNAWFGTNGWTPHKMATILWTSKKPTWAEIHGGADGKEEEEER